MPKYLFHYWIVTGFICCTLALQADEKGDIAALRPVLPVQEDSSYASTQTFGHDNTRAAVHLGYLNQMNPLPLKGNPTEAATLTGAISIQPAWGIGDDYIRIAVNYETPVLYALELPYLGQFDFTVEAGVSYWRATSGSFEHNQLTQLTVLPLIRWWVWAPFFVEGGVGPSYFSDTHFIEKDISTHFQFADHIGIGVQLNDSLRLSARFVHFSNGGIRHPNPGLNICMVSLSYLF